MRMGPSVGQLRRAVDGRMMRSRTLADLDLYGQTLSS